jgi:hypothetical protein
MFERLWQKMHILVKAYFFYSDLPNVLKSKIHYENVDAFKNGLSEKDVDNFYQSNATNKSISNFREIIPLNYISCRISCINLRQLQFTVPNN